MRQTLQALAMQVSVAILSGRDLDDVRKRVAIDAIVYAGNHGFDIAGPRGLRRQEATKFLPALDAAEKELREKLAGIAGAFIERKRFSIAAHYRNVNENDVPRLTRRGRSGRETPRVAQNGRQKSSRTAARYRLG